jgi:CRISPR-associated protein Csb2
MGFAITAEFTLGFYQGRDAAGAPERWPTPARLHAALVAAAAGLGDDGRIPERFLGALRWFEGRPPARVVLPAAHIPSQEVRAYRELGLVSKSSKSKTIQAGRKASAPASRISALAGPVVYWWEDEPDAALVEMLGDLCAEVPYLGERPSVVELTAGAMPMPVNGLERTASRFLPPERSTRLTCPESGRTDALIRAHDERYPDRGPSVARDRWKADEQEVLAPSAGHLREVSYLRAAPTLTDAPWREAYLVEGWLDAPGGGRSPWRPASDELVAWSVALHRALVRAAGFGAPAMLTGRHLPESGPVPANHAAIQIVDPVWPIAGGPLDTSAFLLLLPAGDGAAETLQALQRVRSVYRGRAGKVVLGEVRRVAADRFWAPPAPGFERWWMPTPTAICETRPVRADRGSGPRWSLDDALLLAIGHVWRDLLPSSSGESVVSGRGSRAGRYRRLAARVRATGVRIAQGERSKLRFPERYVHRISKGLIVTGVTGLIRLGTLSTDTQVNAIGQARHLGGGLLVPVDLPAQLMGRREGECDD